MRRPTLLPPTLLSLALLAGCATGPDYDGPPKVASDATARGRFVRAADPAFAAAPAPSRWWEALGDAQLTRLVDEALANSPSLGVAEAKIRESLAIVGQKRAGLFPSVSADATYLHAKLPGVNLTDDSSSGGEAGAEGGGGSSSLNFYNIGSTASWEPDLFGGGRRSVEQARATVGQGYADLADAQVSVAAQVAQAYVNLRDVQQRIRLTSASSELQRKSLALTRQRFDQGAASALEVERLQTDLERTDAQNAPLKAEADDYRNQLAVLTGRTPGALDADLAAPVAVPLPPASVPIDNPAELIARRPDIRSAERGLAAGTAAIGVQKAKLLPGVRFMGILGIGGTKPGDMFDPSNLTALLAPMLSWSFLDFGRQGAAVAQAEAQQGQAAETYRKTVLEALADAEGSLSRFGHARTELAGLARAEQSAGRAEVLNRQRFDAGTSSLIDQLDIERQHLAATVALSQGTARLTNSYIAVQKSLGLGWSAAPAEATR